MKRSQIMTYLLVAALGFGAIRGYLWYHEAQQLQWQKETLYSAWLEEYDLAPAIAPLKTYLQTPDPSYLEQSLGLLLDDANMASRGFTGYFGIIQGPGIAGIAKARDVIRAAQKPEVDPGKRTQALQAVVAGLDELKQAFSLPPSEQGVQILPQNSNLRHQDYVEKTFQRAADRFDAARKILQ